MHKGLGWEDTSRIELGFVTDHPTRKYEYDWILKHFTGDNGRVLDIGAGCSPVPIILSRRGYDVVTVDNGDENNINQPEWNFMDYAKWGCTSYNKDFTSYKARKKFDYIYSISVIEHMTTIDRIATFKHAKKLLTSGGTILLTIDLRHKTNELHNRVRGVKVEDNHGEVDDVLDELIEIGFTGIEYFIHRDIKGISIDTFYIRANG